MPRSKELIWESEESLCARRIMHYTLALFCESGLRILSESNLSILWTWRAATRAACSSKPGAIGLITCTCASEMILTSGRIPIWLLRGLFRISGGMKVSVMPGFDHFSRIIEAIAGNLYSLYE
jgi:hypothetical protein